MNENESSFKVGDRIRALVAGVCIDVGEVFTVTAVSYNNVHFKDRDGDTRFRRASDFELVEDEGVDALPTRVFVFRDEDGNLCAEEAPVDVSDSFSYDDVSLVGEYALQQVGRVVRVAEARFQPEEK